MPPSRGNAPFVAPVNSGGRQAPGLPCRGIAAPLHSGCQPSPRPSWWASRRLASWARTMAIIRAIALPTPGDMGRVARDASTAAPRTPRRAVALGLGVNPAHVSKSPCKAALVALWAVWSL